MFYKFMRTDKKSFITLVVQMCIIIIVSCSLMLIPSVITKNKTANYSSVKENMIIENFDDDADYVLSEENCDNYVSDMMKYINASTGKKVTKSYPFIKNSLKTIGLKRGEQRAAYFNISAFVSDCFEPISYEYTKKNVTVTKLNDEPGVYLSEHYYRNYYSSGMKVTVYQRNMETLNYEEALSLNVNGYYIEDNYNEQESKDYIVLPMNYFYSSGINEIVSFSYEGCVYECDSEITLSDLNKIRKNNTLDVNCLESYINDETAPFKPIFSIAEYFLIVTFVIISINSIVIVYQKNVMNRDNDYIYYVYYEKKSSLVWNSAKSSGITVILAMLISIIFVGITELILKSVLGSAGTLSTEFLIIPFVLFIILFVSDTFTKINNLKHYRKQ